MYVLSPNTESCLPRSNFEWLVLHILLFRAKVASLTRYSFYFAFLEPTRAEKATEKFRRVQLVLQLCLSLRSPFARGVCPDSVFIVIVKFYVVLFVLLKRLETFKFSLYFCTDLKVMAPCRLAQRSSEISEERLTFSCKNFDHASTWRILLLLCCVFCGVILVQNTIPLPLFLNYLFRLFMLFVCE